MLTIFVSQLSLLVFQLFLGDKPEVVDSETLIVVLPRGDFFFFDEALECTALVPHRLLVLLIIVIIDSVGPSHGFLLIAEFLIGAAALASALSLIFRHSTCTIQKSNN